MQRQIENVCKKYVTAGSVDVKHTWSCFLNNCIAHSRKTTRLKTLKVLFDDAKITTAFTHIYIVRQNKSTYAKENCLKARDFIWRKVYGGREKKRKHTLW